VLWRECGCKGRQQLENGMLKQDHLGEEIVDNKTAIFFPELFLVNRSEDLQKG
jgi:hypothetical protein